MFTNNLDLNQKGFSFVSTLVGIGLIGLVAAIAAGIITMSVRGIKTAQRMEDLFQMSDELRTMLANETICTRNFIGLPVVRERSTPVRLIQYFDATGKIAGARVVVQGEEPTNMPGITIKSLQLVPKAWLTAERVVADVEIYAVKLAHDVGATETKKTIPLLLELQNGKVKSCIADTNSGPRFYEKVCMLASDGRMYYDEATGRCLNRYDEQYFAGSNVSAKCPDGWNPLLSGISRIAPCDEVCNYQTFTDPNKDLFQPVTPRKFSDGSSSVAGPRAFHFSYDDASKSCSCAYALDLGTAASNLKCQIKCEHLRVPFTQ